MTSSINNRNTLTALLSVMCLLGVMLMAPQNARADSLREHYTAAGLDDNVYLTSGAVGIDFTSLSLISLSKQPVDEPEAQVVSMQDKHLHDFYITPAGHNGPGGIPLVADLAIEQSASGLPAANDNALFAAEDPVWEMVKDMPGFASVGPVGIGFGIRTALESELPS